MPNLILIGASGIALEIIDTVEAINAVQPTWNLIGILDDNPARRGETFYRGVEIIGTGQDAEHYIEADTFFLVSFCSVRNFMLRPAYIERLTRACPAIRFATIVHPLAWVSPSAVIGSGAFLAPHIVVDAHARIGDHCIGLFGSVISRRVTIGDFGFISAGVNIMGSVQVGTCCFLAVRTTVIRDIGNQVLVNAGALVSRPVPDHAIVQSPVCGDITNFETPDKLQRLLGRL
jgi:sugar O-acyltransferase (sialic acid O-acetyltransferase NeuD family)